MLISYYIDLFFRSYFLLSTISCRPEPRDHKDAVPIRARKTVHNTTYALITKYAVNQSKENKEKEFAFHILKEKGKQLKQNKKIENNKTNTKKARKNQLLLRTKLLVNTN